MKRTAEAVIGKTNWRTVRMKMRLSLRWIYLILLILFAVVFIMAVSMSYHTPYSGRAYVECGMAPVYSKVTGEIEEIYRKNGDPVRKGDPLFRIDSRNYRAEVERLEASCETTRNRLAALDFQIAEEQENLAKLEKTLRKNASDYNRDRGLLEKKIISVKVFEATRLNYDIAVRELAALRKHIESLKLERGAPGEENSELKTLAAQLEIARNNLHDTVIRAPISGLLSCHQLYMGQTVMTNEKYCVIHCLNDITVNVDMMEKSVGQLHSGQTALIAFDALPGRVFHGTLKGIVRELRSSYVAPNEFHQIEEDTRWIRSVGRNRVQLDLTEPLPEGTVLVSGAKAAVSLVNERHPLINWFAVRWINIISLLNYIY